MSQNNIIAYRARWIFPVATSPIENAVVAVRDGTILEVTSKDRWSGPIDEDLGDAAIIPSLVNAHTHLEFSELEKPLGYPGIPFADWIELIIKHRSNRSVDQQSQSTIQGGKESLNTGTVLIGEITTSGYSVDAYACSAILGISFYEVIGLAQRQLVERITDSAMYFKSRISEFKNGISPHAPYTVRWNLLEGLVQIAVKLNMPMAMHVAESLPELEVLENRRGPLRDVLEKLGVWQDDAWPKNISIADYLQVLGDAPRSLIVHGNYLTPEDISIIANNRERMSVVYCPRTHDYFKHSPHAYPEMIESGINVALGTDSRASNPDLSIWEEMRAVAKQGRIPPSEVLKMGTINGSMALGFNDEYGTIKAGCRARLCIVKSLDSSKQIDWTSRVAYENLFEEETICRPIESMN